MLARGSRSFVYTPPYPRTKQFNTKRYVSKICNIKGILESELDIKRTLIKRNLDYYPYCILPENDIISHFSDVIGKTYYYLYYRNGGQTLHSYYQEHKNLGVNEMISHFKYLVECLRFLHSANIYHLDIKGDNIVIDSTGNVRLIDFSLSTNGSVEDFQFRDVYIVWPVWINALNAKESDAIKDKDIYIEQVVTPNLHKID